MATAAENLQTAYNSACQNLVDFLAAPKVSYTVGDRTFSWNEYHKILLDAVDQLREALHRETRFFVVRSVGRA